MKTPPHVVSIGELLWDLLPSGPQLGGAPANLACHVHALGAAASLVSCVGRDRLGDEALRLLQARGLDVACIDRDPERPTGTVVVDVDADGQPRFKIVERVAWDSILATDEAMDRARQADAICFGSLAQRSPAAGRAIQQVVAASRPEALRVFDINLRAPFFDAHVIEGSLRIANVLKLNDAELPVVAEQLGLQGTTEEQVEALAGRFGLEVIALTLGASGSLLYRGGRWAREPARSVAVIDSVGAGDSFTAALVLGLLLDLPTEVLLVHAADVAAFVCTKAGATPELPAELVAPFAVVPSRIRDATSSDWGGARRVAPLHGLGTRDAGG